LTNGGNYQTDESNLRCGACGQQIEPMTGEQSRHLKVGDRVCWGTTTTDLGTVIGKSWSDVTIAWDDGASGSVSHNDMAKVEQVPIKM
jgi:hypothetical protein